MQRFDWGILLRAGVRGLGLKPREFWDLTPVELRLMLGEDNGAAPMGRARLDELLSAFPDDAKGDGS
ncbi:phage tail assembly chaperone [Citreicella sp. C3M06]|uniref:rcc01693 family protein n=1 Tax=Roseobacteraceae TaxID=2854170 RepID=UPI001C0884A5|nr:MULTISPECIES: rcc01693 family protein [Roseobacteraceae]MBU2960139.1 phage tail assembly chaperone [Citreicella sp. C3M06]MDO6586053.1 phage tail assembly chaperone [Salipiger sp. 1_MG-2023]